MVCLYHLACPQEGWCGERGVGGEGLRCMCEPVGVLNTAAPHVAGAEAILRYPSFSHRKKLRPG